MFLNLSTMIGARHLQEAGDRMAGIRTFHLTGRALTVDIRTVNILKADTLTMKLIMVRNGTERYMLGLTSQNL